MISVLPYAALAWPSGLALDVLGIQRGDAVAIPALAPSYYARVLSEKGLVPV